MSAIFTGARGKVYVGTKAIGWVGGVNVTVENTLTDVDVMGQLEVGDLAETGHKCNFSINTFKAIASTATVKPLFNAEGVQINAPEVAASLEANTAYANQFDSSTTASVMPMRNQGYFEVTIHDDQTDEVVFTMSNCKFEGGTGQADARGLWQGTWNFRAQRGHGL